MALVGGFVDPQNENCNSFSIARATWDLYAQDVERWTKVVVLLNFDWEKSWIDKYIRDVLECSLMMVEVLALLAMLYFALRPRLMPSCLFLSRQSNNVQSCKSGNHYLECSLEN